MKRTTITKDGGGRVAVPFDIANVWMNEMELVRLFDVIAPTLRAAIRAVYKSGVLQPCEVVRRIRLPNGYYVEANGRGTRFPYQHAQCGKGAQCPVGKDVLAKRKASSVVSIRQQAIV